MGESTCLLRSFSNPTDISTCMAEKVDPMRLLGESISFGRYMSEGLDWEKWSVFSHKRYVEEAEKFSKPGSVAEKKAYFEAHYKKKAAQKAAASVQEADGSSNSSIQMNSKENINVTVIEQHEKYNFSYADTNEDKRDIQQCEVEISKVVLPKDMPQPLVDPKVKDFVMVGNSNQFDNVEKVAAPKVEKLRNRGNPGQVKAREVKSSPKSSTKATVSKPLYSPVERKAAVQPRSRISSVPNSKRTVRGSAEKKGLSTRSLHMSINLPSCAGETSKTASVLQQNRMRKISLNSPNVSRDQPVASRTSVRAIHDLFNRASMNPQSEGRRTERLFNKSVCKAVSASSELSSASVVCPKSPSSRRPQPTTTLSPFRFRSEGRVAKRKEFFQRMDETKSKEVERMQLQRKSKEKTEHDHKKLQQGSGFKPKQKEDKNGGLHLPSNEMKKTSLTQPKSGSKAASSTSHGKNSRNSWRPPTGISTPKRVTEKMNQKLRGSITSLPKVRQENAPPNIQP
ncbi:hypothetical protein K1719_037136 [Acacia pycnantha]|nr:hypothetical protein K1719_037136 [Acacia pycnantha]